MNREQLATELLKTASLLIKGYESFEPKDKKRIDDIVTKAYKWAEKNAPAETSKQNEAANKKMVALATQMANSITDADKAMRRGNAAEDENYHDLAAIFFDRAKELGHKNASIKTAGNGPLVLDAARALVKIFQDEEYTTSEPKWDKAEIDNMRVTSVNTNMTDTGDGLSGTLKATLKSEIDYEEVKGFEGGADQEYTITLTVKSKTRPSKGSSTKWGIWAIRGESSRMGPAAAWAKDINGKVLLFNSREEAQKKVDEYRRGQSPFSSVTYVFKEYEK